MNDACEELRDAINSLFMEVCKSLRIDSLLDWICSKIETL
jgi:hypothetical protein